MDGWTLREHFLRFLDADPQRLHMAAHSHHPWPDVSFEAHGKAWLDAAAHMDRKWDEVVFDRVVPEARQHVARRLSLPDPATVAFAPNTHELVVRVLSCLEVDRPARILTTDAEFHSFDRQSRRLEEAGMVTVQRVPAEPFGSFPDRFAEAAGTGGHELVFVSHVFFDSGYVVPDLEALVAAVPDDDTLVVIDGYHGFMALPTDLSGIADRVFYVAGGYKYAMAGEGACFLHAPSGYGPRPVFTGWYAGFGHLEDERARGGVPYAEDGGRFWGSTFDPSGLYRFNAVQRWLDDLGIEVRDIHRHVRSLQRSFLDRLEDGPVAPATLVPGDGEVPDRGHFLTFQTGRAGAIVRALGEQDVVVDHRGDRLRLGFGCYHREEDLEVMSRRLRVAVSSVG